MKSMGLLGIRVVLLFPAIAVLCMTCFCSYAVWGQEEKIPEENLPTVSSLVIELATDKKVYKVGEPIMITVTLRNASRDEGFWVGKSSSITRWPGAFMLDVYDVDGKRLPDRIPFAHSVPSPKDVDLVEMILKTRTLFGPGDFLGFTRTLERCGYTIREPGRYRLQANYGDHGLSDIADANQIEAAKKHDEGWILKIPLWSGEIESSSVWIRVVP